MRYISSYIGFSFPSESIEESRMNIDTMSDGHVDLFMSRRWARRGAMNTGRNLNAHAGDEPVSSETLVAVVKGVVSLSACT